LTYNIKRDFFQLTVIVSKEKFWAAKPLLRSRGAPIF